MKRLIAVTAYTALANRSRGSRATVSTHKLEAAKGDR